MKPVVYLEKLDTRATLATWVYCAFWQMRSAEKKGFIPYINWPANFSPSRALEAYYDNDHFHKNPNMFNWYFDQPFIKNPPPREECEIWTWETWLNEDDHCLMSEPLSNIKEYYSKNLKFNEAVEARGQDLVEKYKIDFSNTIGLTWRGTDNVTDGRPRLPIEVYYPFIDDILEKNPQMRIMCTAEEETILDPLLKRYKESFAVEEFISSPLGNLNNPERLSLLPGYERGMQPALMIWLFSKCAHYIKNRSSSGGVASWISTGRIVNLAHPENLAHEQMPDQVEIGGQRFPLYR
jgi:hypothetical protein